jgi:hypothetical protein
MSSDIPTTPPKVQSPLLNTTTKRIVVKVATILQEIAFAKLLTGFSKSKSPLQIEYLEL